MMSLDLAVTTSQADSLSRPTRVYPSWAFQICRSRVYPTSMGERAGVRGYGLSSDQRPSPDLRSLSSGGALRRPVGKSTSPSRGEVNQHPGKLNQSNHILL